MFTVSTFFFSSVIGKKVFSTDGKTLGRLKELIADSAGMRPKIIGAVVSFKDGQKTVDFSNFKITASRNRCHIVCTEVKPVSVEEDGMLSLFRQVLNAHVVDMNKKKLVPVNDLKIAVLSTGAYVVAVDAGFEGRLRRLGILKPVRKLLKLFDATVPRHMVLWDDIETINFGKTGTGLSKSVMKLSRLHPSDMADIIEDMDHDAQLGVFSALDTERAADVLEELETDTRESLLESLPAEKAADVLEIMPADEAADILDEIDEEKAEEILKEMDSEASGEVRELMEYEDYEVGSLMTTDFICFHDYDTVGFTLETLRREKPESDTIYYLYITSDKGELIATVSLRDIVISDPDVKLGDIMNRDVVYVQDTDRIDSLNDILAKYSLLAVPVVDTNKILIGMVIINDVMYNLLRSRRKRL